MTLPTYAALTVPSGPTYDTFGEISVVTGTDRADSGPVPSAVRAATVKV